MSTEQIRASTEAYIAAWNEHDTEKRARLLEKACADDLVLLTAGRRVTGRGELATMIADFQRRHPEARAVLSSGIDVQGTIFPYPGRVEGSALGGAPNMDAGECAADGRIRVLFTFTGAAPPAQL